MMSTFYISHPPKSLKTKIRAFVRNLWRGTDLLVPEVVCFVGEANEHDGDVGSWRQQMRNRWKKCSEIFAKVILDLDLDLDQEWTE